MTTEGMIRIALAVLTIASTFITSLLIPYLKRKISADDRSKIATIVRCGVMAAEQIYHESGQGQKKKEYVIEYLRNAGIKISEEELDVLIEAAVKELNLWQAEFEQ